MKATACAPGPVGLTIAAKARTSRQGARSRLKDNLSIPERPAESEDWAVPGHWQSELILRREGKSTIVELPERLLRSLTWDQSKEMPAHADFKVATDIGVCVCDPHSAWQRGMNKTLTDCSENT